MLLMSPPFIVVNLLVLPLQHGLSGRNMLTLFDILTYASTTQNDICSFELSLLSCFLTFVYQLIVKSMRAFIYRGLLLLWSVKPFYSGITRRNKLQYLIHIQDRVKEVVFRRSDAIQLLILFYPGVSPPLCQKCHENCTASYELLTQWYFSPSLFISRFPCCYNRNADKWIVMCEFSTPSNLVAW